MQVNEILIYGFSGGWVAASLLCGIGGYIWGAREGYATCIEDILTESPNTTCVACRVIRETIIGGTCQEHGPERSILAS